MTVTIDAADLNPAGWPRPRLPLRDGTTLPAPWVATVWPAGDLEPARFDSARIDEIFANWLCQVCGQPCEEEAWSPVTDENLYNDNGTRWWEISGGPTCSDRCVRLALAVCPHFAYEARVIRFFQADVQYAGNTLVVNAWSPTSLTPVPS
jgi:hypothetical protein